MFIQRLRRVSLDFHRCLHFIVRKEGMAYVFYAHYYQDLYYNYSPAPAPRYLEYHVTASNDRSLNQNAYLKCYKGFQF